MELKKKCTYLSFVFFRRNLSEEYTRVPPFQPRGTRLFAHVCGVLRRLGTYLRQLLWYMEVAPKFPRGVVRLLAALFSLSLSLKQPSAFSPRLSLLFRLSRSLFSDLPLHPYNQPSRILASVRAFIWPTCFRIRVVILARSLHSRAESTWNYQDCGPRRRC